jgi:two-component system chemotaxis response regulator CheY
MRTLIVEDDPTSRMILSHLLAPFGVCDMACNGREALTMFEAALDRHQTYDLICLDIMMPEMDGLEALIEIRKIESAHGNFNQRQSKVIIITALNDLREAMNGLKLMCQEYLVKPVNRHELMEKLVRLGLIVKPSSEQRQSAGGTASEKTSPYQ